MKQYYESEVLFQLMERDGFNIPSSVPPYEAEIKAYLINQVKQAYPKLTDYEAEWLLYNYTKHLPADFPISSVSNVTEATFENVVPFAYQSAILSGNTLVNLIGEKRAYDTPVTKKLYGWEFMLPYNLTSGKTYLAIFDVFGTIDETNSKVYLMDDGFDSPTGNTSSTVPTFSLGHNVVKCIATNDIHKVLRIRTTYNINEKFTVSNVMLIEYQEGMENWDIPYFEGMQSVKMPVLKTTGKNLFDKTKITKNYGFNSDTIVAMQDCFVSDYIPVRPNTDYKLIKTSRVHIFDKNKTLITYPKPTDGIFTTPTNASFIRINGQLTELDIWQVEEGSTTTSYEPYKTNILTVNEDVELRGIGDVQDTLDLMTGEVVNNFSSYRFSDTDKWNTNTETNSQRFTLNVLQSPVGAKYSNTLCIISDRLYGVKWKQSWDTVNTISCNDNAIVVHLPLGTTIEQCKEFMRNSIAIYRTTESIKTVDLTTVNEKGETTYFMPLEGTMNVQSSGEIIKPTFDMTVPVEATTQNLASFIELEMRNNHE